MPRVVFVAPSAYVLSGLASWLDYVIPGLNDQGWDAWLGLVSGPRHHLPDAYLAAHPCTQVAIAHCDTGTAEGRRIAMSRLLDTVRPDVAVSVNIPDLLVAINQCRLSGRTAPHAVMSVHGIEADLFADAQRFRPMLDAVVNTNRLALALTASLAGIEQARNHYAACGVHLPMPAKPPVADTQMQIVYSGRLDETRKRVGDLVGIVQSLKRRSVPFCMHIAGDGPARPSLEAALRVDIAESRAVFHGHVSPLELKQCIYSGAHALLITSSTETGPIVAWEAMAQGIPVVSTRYIGSGLERALTDGRNALLFEVGDTSGAAAVLARLWEEPAMRSSLCAAARQLVVDRYSIPVSIKTWDYTLRSVLAEPQAGAMCPLKSVPSGRLDRWLGVSLGEAVRSLLPRGGRDAPDAGGEWPHSHSRATSDKAFWQLAKDMDADLASPQRQQSC